MKIRVCIPFYSEFETTKPGLFELDNCKEIDFAIEPRQGSVVRRTRNSFMNDMRSSKIHQKPMEGFDYFLMVDSDISFKLRDVLKLISNDKDICCAPYTMHNNPKIYDTGMAVPQKPGKIMGRYTIAETGLKKIDWTGAGFMLMKAEIFEKMEYPWYRHILVTDGENQEETSEDIGLCINAQNSGFDIWCDFDVEIGHKPRGVESFDWDISSGGLHAKQN